MIVRSRYRDVLVIVAIWLAMFADDAVFGQAPPVLSTVFPMGAQVGQTVEITVIGGNLQGIRTLHCNVSGISCERLDQNRFRLSIPADAPIGMCDLWAVGDNGVSSSRTFVISNRLEQSEVEPKEITAASMSVPLNVVINGRIDKAGDVDHFRFDAKQGQRVVIECSAERIDSRLRAVIELFDAAGKRLAVNRGYFGIDPLIDFRVPTDGAYVVKIQDLTSSGNAEHYYRLDIDSGPRVAFTVPSVIERGKASRVTLHGWNLKQQSEPEGVSPRTGSVVESVSVRGLAPSGSPNQSLDHIEVEIPASLADTSWPLGTRLHPAQAVIEGASFPYHFPGSHISIVIGVADVPVVLDGADNHSPTAAQKLAVPCEVSGQLVERDERDWFAIDARRGEVFFVEGFGQRIQSPVDLQISVLDSAGQSELAQFGDEVQNIGGLFSTNHLDPSGRWVCPQDGRYLVVIQNLIGGSQPDPRRIYRLSLRREEPDFHLVAVPHRDDLSALNVRRGGREVLDLLAFRQRGFDGAIRVSAKDLPAGLECPDVWLGPGVDRTVLVVSADQNGEAQFGELKLVGSSTRRVEPLGSGEPSYVSRMVRGGTIVRSGTPNGWGRITSQIPFAVVGEASLRITADAHEVIEHHLYGKLAAKHSPGGVVDVAIHIERRDTGHQAAVKLIGVGLPDSIPNQTAVIAPGEKKGYLSFYLPQTLPVGRYSFAVRAETSIATTDKKTETVAVISNLVTIDVQPAAFVVEVDPFAVTRAKRGETIKVSYSAKRINGFIGKMHTELAAPGRVTDIVGLRGRGETFTGQTDKGTLQIVINDDAPLGRQNFLRLFTVGVVEDEAKYFGSGLFPLEIIE